MDCFEVALQASLVVIYDSIAQPGGTLFDELLARLANRQEKVGLLAVSGNGKCSANIVDLKEEGELSLERILAEATATKCEWIFIDSISILALLFSQHAVVLFLRGLLKAGIRIVTVLNLDLPSMSQGEIALHSALNPHTLTPNYALLSLHHPELLESLRSTYNIRIDDSAQKHDQRLYSFLTRFSRKGWGGHGLRNSEADAYEAKAIYDPLGNQKFGHCILEWHFSDALLKQATSQRKNTGSRHRQDDSAITARGISGLTKSESGSLRLSPVSEVLPPLKIAKAGKVDGDPLATITAGLPFNLNLSEDQRKAKDGVILPYVPQGSDRNIPGAAITYEPDSNDDMDPEEDDEEL